MKLIRLFLIVGFTLLSQLTFSQYYYTKDSTDTPGGLNQDNTLINPASSVGGWTTLMGPSVTTPIWSANQTIPFAFNFNGAPVTEFKVSSTGVLTFTTSAVSVPGPTPAALPDAEIPDNSICMWGLVASGSNDYVATKTFGNSGSQQHWIHFASCVNGPIAWSYWSIVLEEGTNRIYIVDQYDWSLDGALSVGIQINPTTAYSDPLSPAVPSSATSSVSSDDDLYYTFIYGVQEQNDLELTSLNFLPYVAPGAADITGTILNTGTDPITSLTVTWDDGTGPHVDNITGLNIGSNQPYDFTSPTPLNTVAGNTYQIDVNVTASGETNFTDNDLSAPTFAVTSIPTKYVVGEEKTGTWCGWCPRGAVGLAHMESVPTFIGIAVHNGDPMTVDSYDGSIDTYVPGGYPAGGIDRVESGNPIADNLLAMYNNRAGATVPCDVKNITVDYDSTSNEITVSAESEWFGTISGNYRFSCVIVEDDIIETGTDWLQANYYFDGTNGSMAFPAGINNEFDFGSGDEDEDVDPTLFGGYDHVARSLSNDDILGDAGSLPVGSVPAGVHSYTFDPISADILKDINKCHAIVMIINATTGEILNAYKTDVVEKEGVGVSEIDNSLKLELYPNPASDQVNISFNLQGASKAKVTIMDALGNRVMSSGAASLQEGANYVSINTSTLTSGIYFVNVSIDNQTVIKRLSVIR